MGRQQPGPRSVAVGDTLVGAFVATGADPFGRFGFGFHQLLHHDPDRLTDQVHAVTGTERLGQLGHGGLGERSSKATARPTYRPFDETVPVAQTSYGPWSEWTITDE
ncbi:hypothetical protein GCM10027448_40660 [Nocardioides dilutus]